MTGEILVDRLPSKMVRTTVGADEIFLERFYQLVRYIDVTQIELLPFVDLRDIELSHDFPRPQSTDGNSQTKWCVGCKTELPLEKFYYNRTNDTYFSRCKPCASQQAKEYREKNPDYWIKWHKSHHGKQLHYALKSQQKALSAGRKKKRYPKSEDALKRSKEAVRNKKILRRAEVFERIYGRDFAANYVSLMSSGSMGSGKNAIKILKLTLLPASLASEPWAYVHRVEKLNVFSGKPFGFTGPWFCKCGISSCEPRFFDIDHVIPRAKGGSSKLHNLQILCPNCHRTKTIRDYPHSGFNECVPAAHTPGVISTTAPNGADVLTNQATYMGFQAGVPDAQTVASPSVILLGPTGRGGSTTEPE